LGNFTLGAEGLALAQLVFFDQATHMIHNLHVVGNEAVAVDHKTQLLDGNEIRYSSMLRQGNPPEVKLT
jgi:hypothetical protein